MSSTQAASEAAQCPEQKLASRRRAGRGGKAILASSALVACLAAASSSAAEKVVGVSAASRRSCDYALQMMHLQDISWSYKDKLEDFQNYFPELAVRLVDTYPGSLLSVATFTDNPFPDVGYAVEEPLDYCFKQHTNFTDSRTEIEDGLKDLYACSGRDEPEAQLTAIHHAAKGGYYHERQLPGGLHDLKVLVMTTDASYHVAGDLAVQQTYHGYFRLIDSPLMTGLDGEFTVRPNDGDGELSCSGYDQEDYPTETQVIDALVENDVILIALVTPNVLHLYQSLQNQFSARGAKVVIVEVDGDAGNAHDLFVAMNTALQEVHEIVCPLPTDPPSDITQEDDGPLPPPDAPTSPPHLRTSTTTSTRRPSNNRTTKMESATTTFPPTEPRQNAVLVASTVVVASTAVYLALFIAARHKFFLSPEELSDSADAGVPPPAVDDSPAEPPLPTIGDSREMMQNVSPDMFMLDR